MKRYTIGLITLLVTVGCSQKPVDETTLIEKDGVMYLPNSDKPYTGEVFINYDTGEKLYQGTYENGLLIQYSYLNEDGSVKEPINYETSLVERDGVYYTKDTNKPYSGPVFGFFNFDRDKREGSLKDGKEDGLWTWVYENGQKAKETTFKDGKEVGLETGWFKEGQKRHELLYKEDGQLILTQFYKNGQKRQEERYKDHITPDGPDGKVTRWYENGQKQMEGIVKEGDPIGFWTYWYENGQKQMEGTFKDRYPDGFWTFWYGNGQKKKEETYKDGDLISEKCWEEFYPGDEKECN